MAGPGFDTFQNGNHSKAAKFVQCLHSSRDKGTRIYSCDRNIRFGLCGHKQPAAVSQSVYSNHGLCVQMYINSFEYPFYGTTSKPLQCKSLVQESADT